MHYQHKIQGVWVEGLVVTFLNGAEFMGACWFIRYMQQQYCVSKCPLVTAKKNYDFFPPACSWCSQFADFYSHYGATHFHFCFLLLPTKTNRSLNNSTTVWNWLDFSRPPLTQHSAERFTKVQLDALSFIRSFFLSFFLLLSFFFLSLSFFPSST